MAIDEILTYDFMLDYHSKKNRQKHLLLGNGFSMSYDSGIFSYNALNKFIDSVDNLCLKSYSQWLATRTLK